MRIAEKRRVLKGTINGATGEPSMPLPSTSPVNKETAVMVAAIASPNFESVSEDLLLR
jgi:hypothetical protein